MEKKHSGFTLIELLVVILVIGIIAAIAVARLTSAVRTANEASAQAAMRLLSQAETSHYILNGNYAEFSVFRLQGVLDERFEVNSNGEAQSSGYLFKFIPLAPSTPPNFLISARPVSTNPVTGTGSRKFGVSNNNVLYFDTGDLENHFQTVAELLAATPAGN